MHLIENEVNKKLMETPNLLYIKEVSGGDIDFEKNLIKTLKEEFPKDVKEFYKNFESKNYIETANSIHKIKHKMSILGLKKGVELASSFELELKQNSNKLYADFVKILNKIDLYLCSK